MKKFSRLMQGDEIWLPRLEKKAVVAVDQPVVSGINWVPPYQVVWFNTSKADSDKPAVCIRCECEVIR